MVINKNNICLPEAYSIVLPCNSFHGDFFFNLTLIDYNFVAVAPNVMKFGTGMKFDVFYTMVTKNFVTSVLLRNYDVKTCI